MVGKRRGLWAKQKMQSRQIEYLCDCVRHRHLKWCIGYVLFYDTRYVFSQRCFCSMRFVSRGHFIVKLQTPTHNTAETSDGVVQQSTHCTILLHLLLEFSVKQCGASRD